MISGLKNTYKMIKLTELLTETPFMSGIKMRTSYFGKKYREASVLIAKQILKQLIKKYGSIENVLVKHFDHADLRNNPKEDNDFANNRTGDEIKILPNGNVEFLQGFMGSNKLQRSGISDNLEDYIVFLILKDGPKKK